MNITQMNHFWQQYSAALQLPLFQLEEITVTLGMLAELIILSALLIWFSPKINSVVLRYLSAKSSVGRDLAKRLVKVSRWIVLGLGFMLIFEVVGVHGWIARQLGRLYQLVQSVVDLNLFKLGHTQVTLLAVVYILTCTWLLVRLTSHLQGLVANRILGRTKIDLAGRQAMGSTVHYVVLCLGFVILLQTAGIDLSAVTVLLGALGIGISFGLQTITNNFISGIIILFERPIKVGDRIQVGDVIGDVISISLRATTVVTNENIAIVVPNSQFVTANVVNWTYTGRSVGIKFPITVSSKSDPKRIQRAALEVIKAHPGVLKKPPPSVLLDEITDSYMKFSVRIWTQEFLATPDSLRSDLNLSLAASLAENDLRVSPVSETSNLLKSA